MTGPRHMVRPLLACALAASACAHYYKLDVKSVTALEVGGDTKTQVCARGALVDVLAVTKDGQKHAEGDGDHVRENEFDPALVKLEASIGTFHDRSWNPPPDPLALLGADEITVTATLVANPQITASAKLVPTWACDAPVAYLGGEDGGQGSMGVQDGEAGEAGGAAANGQNVVVTIGWVQHGAGRIAVADVQADSGQAVYVLDPSTPLKLLAGGGAGGAGGSGGWGRGMETCEGRGGPGGSGGRGGDGGDGGNVTIRYDAASPELANLIIPDVHGGDAGPGGSGGGGGAGPNGCGTWGAEGKEGEEGRPGRQGRVSSQPVRGISDQFAGLAHGGAPPKVDVPRPSRPSPGAPPPVAHDTADGARYYSGRAELTATAPHRKPEHEHVQVRVESTRTRKRHFTIAFGVCKLAFHRPPGEDRHRYVLDAPASCPTANGPVDIKDATLELDTAKDSLSLAWTGTGQVKTIGTVSFGFTFTGLRR